MKLDPAAGLCPACRHVRHVISGRGSTFLLCRRSADDPQYARYPRLPVLRCPGFDERPAGDTPAEPRRES